MSVGLGGFASLSLPGLMRLRAESAPAPRKEKPAVIMVWLPGGLTHLDTYDPKPDSGSEYRGPFNPIPTNVPGTHLTELLPLHAKIADKFTLIRGMKQMAGGHPAGSMQLLSGDPDTRDKPKPRLPDWMSVAAYLRARAERRTNPLPNYIGVSTPLDYTGPAFLGDAYSPFTIADDPNQPRFEVPNLGVTGPGEAHRLGHRAALRGSLDTLERAFDRAGELGALDQFESQALSLLTNPRTRDAFDLSQEDARTRDRYGRNRWGQQLLLARRLVEAGVEIITSQLTGPLCGRTGVWDDHAVDHHIFDVLRFRMGNYDRAVTALIEDLHARGLDRRVLLVVTGEFGRTPRISFNQSTGAGDGSGPAGTIQPGRDHWPNAFTNLWSGGGGRMGGVIGATDRRGEEVTSRPCLPADFLATLYQHLGLDWQHATLQDFTGRPTHIVSGGSPITELLG